MDIKKFFAPTGSSKKQSAKSDSSTSPKSTKQKRRIQESDDDDDDDDNDFQPALTQPKQVNASKSTTSDETKTSAKTLKRPKKEEAPEIVDPKDFFGSSSKKTKASTNKTKKQMLDEDAFVPISVTEDLPKLTPPVKAEAPPKETVKKSGKTTKATATSTATKTPKESKKSTEAVEDGNEDHKIQATKTETEEKPVEKKKSGYRDMLAREAPKALGSRPKPVGKPNCLEGLTFVVSGILETLSKEETTDIIKRYGGRLTSAVSGKTSYLVRGRDAGQSKTDKATSLGTAILDEDGFYNLIESSEAKQPESAIPEKKKASTSSTSAPVSTAKASNASSSTSAVSKETKLPTTKQENTVGEAQLWTEKYRPTKSSEILGNKELVRKTKEWLSQWQMQLTETIQGNDMSGSRALIFSGPPGIGKTTTAQVVAQECGYETLELNASDVRSKNVLKESIGDMVDNRTMTEFFSGGSGSKKEKSLLTSKKVVLIMDEVDGMSAGDRGGAVELAALIKKTKIPVICICNDIRSPKVQPLLRVCFDARFKRTPANQLRAKLLNIAFKENLKMETNAVDQLVSATGNDIRQIINIMSTYRLASTNMNYDQAKAIGRDNEKYSQMSIFEVPGTLLGASSWHNMNLAQKSDIYFHDYALSHLMMFENYAKAIPEDASRMAKTGRQAEVDCNHLALLAKASESIADGDLVDSMIHGSIQQYSLMPVHSIFSCVRPASFMKGAVGGRPNFPGWLGRNSKAGKYARLLSDVQTHIRVKASGDKFEVRQNYLPALNARIFKSLKEENYDEAMDIMDTYYLDRENLDTLSELELSTKQPMAQLSTKTKSTFTRMYNARNHPILFQVGGPLFKKDIATPKEDAEGTIFEEESDEEAASQEGALDEEDDLASDKLIKESKKRKTPAKAGGSSQKRGKKA